MVKCEVRFGLYLAARPKQSSLLLIYMSVSLNELTLKKCARILGHHLELNYYSDKLISTLTLPRQSELKFAGWGLCFVHLLYFRVSTSDRPCAHHRRATQCPPASHQFRTSCETPKQRQLFNRKTRFNCFMSCDDQFLQAQASFRTSETSTSFQLPNLQE